MILSGRNTEHFARQWKVLPEEISVKHIQIVGSQMTKTQAKNESKLFGTSIY